MVIKRARPSLSSRAITDQGEPEERMAGSRVGRMAPGPPQPRPAVGLTPLITPQHTCISVCKTGMSGSICLTGGYENPKRSWMLMTTNLWLITRHSADRRLLMSFIPWRVGGAQQNVVRSAGFVSDRPEFKSQLSESPAVTLSELPNLSETVVPSVKWEQQEQSQRGCEKLGKVLDPMGRDRATELVSDTDHQPGGLGARTPFKKSFVRSMIDFTEIQCTAIWGPFILCKVSSHL